ncbi:MAG: hypothetical protein Q9218_006700, partial [Villophora microphyllina]
MSFAHDGAMTFNLNFGSIVGARGAVQNQAFTPSSSLQKQITQRRTQPGNRNRRERSPSQELINADQNELLSQMGDEEQENKSAIRQIHRRGRDRTRSSTASSSSHQPPSPQTTPSSTSSRTQDYPRPNTPSTSLSSNAARSIIGNPNAPTVAATQSTGLDRNTRRSNLPRPLRVARRSYFPPDPPSKASRTKDQNTKTITKIPSLNITNIEVMIQPRRRGMRAVFLPRGRMERRSV